MFTDPLICRGTSILGQKQLISGTMHCFFEGESFTILVACESLCLFPNTDDNDDDDGTGASKATGCSNVFLALLAFFHKLFTFLTLA